MPVPRQTQPSAKWFPLVEESAPEFGGDASFTVDDANVQPILSRTMTNNISDLEAMVRDFVSRVQLAVTAEAAARVRSAIASTFAGTPQPSVHRQAIAKAPKPTGAAPVKRKLQLSPAALAARKIQGQYMGLLRGLSQANKERVKKHAKENGVSAAVKFGKTLK